MVIECLGDEKRVRDCVVIQLDLLYGFFICFVEKSVQFVPELFWIVEVMSKAVFIVVRFCISCLGLRLVPQVSVVFPITRVS